MLVHGEVVSWLPFMYSPIVQTLKLGFENANWRVETSTVRTARNSQGRHDEADKLMAGDVFVWVGVNYMDGLSTISEMQGVLRVFYNTEPLRVNITSNSSRCPLLEGNGDGKRRKPSLAMDEWWDYSNANIQAVRKACSATARLPRFRFVPPGRGAVANETQPPPPLPPSVRTMVLLGDIGERNPRRACYANLRRFVPNALRHTYRVWTSGAWLDMIKGQAIFVNLHKICGDATQPLETVRLAQIISSGRLVISEPSNAEDESAYASIPSFIVRSNMSEIAEAFRNLTKDSDVRWRGLAESGRAEFRQLFDPSAIFQRAGVHELLRRRSLVERRRPEEEGPAPRTGW